MRIGHISDIHLRHHLPGSSPVPARRSREAPALLQDALLALKNDGTDLVAVTGDIVDIPTGATESSRKASEAATADDYRLCRDILSASGIPYIIVPGNHDDNDAMERIFAAATGFRDFGDLRFVSFWDREHEGHVPRRVGRELSLFDETLRSDHPQVHLQHFVITPELTANYPYLYDNHDELLRRIVDSGRVKLSLSGHYHPGTELIQIGTTYFSTAPALAEHPHRYRIYDVTEMSVTMAERSVRPDAFTSSGPSICPAV